MSTTPVLKNVMVVRMQEDPTVNQTEFANRMSSLGINVVFLVYGVNIADPPSCEMFQVQEG